MLGASFDTPAENKAFAEAQNFPFRLLADPDKTAGRAYQVARGDDEQYAGFAMRIAYLIDPEGIIRRAYEVKDVAGFADQVIADLGELGATA